MPAIQASSHSPCCIEVITNIGKDLERQKDYVKDFDWACCTCRATRSCERVGVGLIWPREYLQILEQKGISLQDSLFSVSEVHFFDQARYYCLEYES